MRYLVLLLFTAVLAACAAAAAPTPIPPTATAVPPVEITAEVLVVTPEPSPTPAVCTPLPEGMDFTATLESDTLVTIEITGLQPGEDIKVIYLWDSGGAYHRIEGDASADADGRFTEKQRLRLPEKEPNTYQIQVIHARGVACAEIALPETAVIQPCPDIKPGEMVGSVTEEDGRSTYINPVMGIQVEYPASLRLAEPQYEIPDSYGFFIDEGRATERPFVGVNWLTGLTAEQLETHIQAVVDAYPTIPVERETIAAAGQEAILLAPLPGAETTSHVYLTANNRVYQLIFWQYPLDETARQFLDGLRFMPPTVGYNCLNWPASDGAPPVPTVTPTPDPETLLTYQNDFYGYQLQYPAKVKTHTLGINSMPIEEVDESKPFEDQLEELASIYPDDICITLRYRSGFIAIMPSWEGGMKYVIPSCGRTGIGDYDVKPVTKTVTVNNLLYQISGWAVYEQDEEAAWRSEFFSFTLENGINIQFGGGSGPGSESGYRENTEPVLLDILASVEQIEPAGYRNLAEPSAETLLLYTAVTTPTNTTYWGLSSWPASPPFTEELFATFYGRTAHAEDMRRYFFNFRPQLSPDGRYLILPGVSGYGRPPQDKNVGLWLVDLVDGHLRRLLPRPVIADWSPDGRQIAYAQDGALYTRALDEAAAPQPIFTHPDLSPIFVDWSPDGRQLAAMTISQDETGPSGTVWLVPADGVAPQQLPAAIPLSFEPVRSQLAWSPDGRYLLAANTVLDSSGNVTAEYVAGQITWLPEENRLLVVDGGRMWLADTAGRETAVISEQRPSAWAFSPDGRQLAWAQKVEESGQIAIYFTDLSTLETQFAGMAPTRGFFQMRWGPDGRLYLDDWAQNRIWAMEARLRSTAQLAVEDAALVAIIPLLTPPANQSDGWSGSPVVSDDGRVAAFLSNGRLTDHTHNSRTAVYARDLAAAQNWLASFTLSWQRPFDDIQNVALSGNGRTAAFYSFDGRLTLDDDDPCQTDFDGPCEDLFVTDWETGETERIPLGRTSGLGADYTMALSADGRKLAYGGENLMLYDRDTGQATPLLTTIDGAPPDGVIFGPVFAANGDIAFASRAGNLVPGDDNEAYDVFVWDSGADTVERISIASDGVQANDASGAILFHEGAITALDISDDGRFVAFASMATNLTADSIQTCQDYRGYERACYNIFIHDRETDETRLVTQNSNGDSPQLALSGDGRTLVFSSAADNLTLDAPSCDELPVPVNCGHIYLYDVQTGDISLVDRTPDGRAGNGVSFHPAVSADGRIILFASTSSNLVPGDTNRRQDIFLYNRDTGQIERISLTN